MNHLEKWKEVLAELRQNHPNSNPTLWTEGYVFGMQHAADMASRSLNTVGNAKPKCDQNQRKQNQGPDET